MIIRSQDKKIIVNFNSIDTIDVRDKQVRYFANGGVETMGLLGTYSTEEKAIKVLDMICAFATDKYYEKVVTEQCGCIGGVVFDMPQDSEV